MKKLLFSVAVLALCACSNDEVVSDSNSVVEPREISFAPLTKPNTRAAVQGTAFPTNCVMEVRAYQSAPTPAEYFEQTTFSKGAQATYWGGTPSKYWPLSVATLNFFAVARGSVVAADITIADALASATVNYKTTGNPSQTAYSATTQSDIMYAFGRGSVTQSGNALTFPDKVDMTFKHALALVDFKVKGNSATETSAIKVNSITLKGAKYNGTLTLTNTGATAVSGDVTTDVSWVAGDAVESVAVPGISSGTAITAEYARIGDGLMIIPGTGFTSFVINYTLNGLTYDYEYTPSPTVSTTAATKYTYQINFTLHEILINPSVTDWVEAGGNATTINIPNT